MAYIGLFARSTLSTGIAQPQQRTVASLLHTWRWVLPPAAAVQVAALAAAGRQEVAISPSFIDMPAARNRSKLIMSGKVQHGAQQGAAASKPRPLSPINQHHQRGNQQHSAHQKGKQHTHANGQAARQGQSVEQHGNSSAGSLVSRKRAVEHNVQNASVKKPRTDSKPNNQPSAQHQEAVGAAEGQQAKQQGKQKRKWQTAAGKTTKPANSQLQAQQQQADAAAVASKPKPSQVEDASGKPGPAGRSNWEALRARIGANGEGAKKRQAHEAAASRKPRSMGSNTGVTPILAMDCEMVGVGPGGERSALARVAVVNQHGNTLLDVFVRPKEHVTDFRTKHSGVRPADLLGPNCIELEEAQRRVAALIKDKMLVGHGLSNDFTVLMLDHPRKDVRDTARYAPLMRSPGPGRKLKPRALRHLAAEQLGLDIQQGEHSPVDDARAALYLYLKHRKEWEHAIATGSLKRTAQAVKEARRTALAAATQLATAGSGAGMAVVSAAVLAANAAAKDVLTAAQLRALRTGRGVKRVLIGVAAGEQKDSGKTAHAGGKFAGSVVSDGDEVAELVSAAVAAPAVGSRGSLYKQARSMADVLTRDVRLDPLADL